MVTALILVSLPAIVVVLAWRTQTRRSNRVAGITVF